MRRLIRLQMTNPLGQTDELMRRKQRQLKFWNFASQRAGNNVSRWNCAKISFMRESNKGLIKIKMRNG